MKGVERIAVVLVNWNGWRDTADCLRSVEALADEHCFPVVVDNKSEDSSVEMLRRQFPNVELIEAQENLGFAGGCNLGVSNAVKLGADVIWLLNNDAVAQKGATDDIRSVVRAFPESRFFGSYVALFSDPKTLWFEGGSFKRNSGAITINHGVPEVFTVDGVDVCMTQWASGCSLFFRVADLQEIGLMDEDYFLYREEVEWQIRHAKAERKVVLIAKPMVLHKVGQSTGTTMGFLGTAFMSRNFLKLGMSEAGSYFPIWVIRWFTMYLLRPSLMLEFRRVYAAIVGLLSVRRSGQEARAAIIREMSRVHRAH